MRPNFETTMAKKKDTTEERIEAVQDALSNWEIIAKEKLNINPFQCKKCGQVSLEIVQVINAERAPPINIAIG